VLIIEANTMLLIELLYGETLEAVFSILVLPDGNIALGGGIATGPIMLLPLPASQNHPDDEIMKVLPIAEPDGFSAEGTNLPARRRCGQASRGETERPPKLNSPKSNYLVPIADPRTRTQLNRSPHLREPERFR
jgi:hypothetical protein